jgi:hypothetical protein
MKKACDIDPTDIDELDEIDDGQQYALVWCQTHERYEWHWIAQPSSYYSKRKKKRHGGR